MSSARTSNGVTGHHRVAQFAVLINGFPFDSRVFSSDADVPLVRIRDLSASEFETFVPRAVVPSTALVRDGDVVIGMDGDFNSVLWNRGEAALNQRVCLLRARSDVDPRYLAYAIPTHLQEINELTWSTTVKHLAAGSVRAIRIPAWSYAQQRAIADYLDRETAQIDAFIAKNEELIALLTERRNSVWSDLYMEAASTARIAPLRRFVSSITDGPFGSSLTSAHYSDAGTRVIRLGNIGINEFKAGDEAFISNDYAATLTAHAALPGDVIVAGLGDDRMPLGRACVLPDIGPAIVKADCYRIRPTHSVSPAFLAWVLSAPPTRGLMKLAARGSTRERLNTSVVLDIEVPIPVADAQADLVKRFATSAATIDEARGVAERGVSLARERRAALISAAVTGKIDVGVAA